jgi:hypothetical protein
MRISRRRCRVGALLAVSLIVSAGVVNATSTFEFDRWMKRIEKHSLSVQRNLKRRDAPAAIVDANEIQKLYKLMEDFYAARDNVRDAVRMSKEGKELAGQVADSAAAGDFDSALKSAIVVAKACRECHNQYKPLD